MQKEEAAGVSESLCLSESMWVLWVCGCSNACSALSSLSSLLCFSLPPCSSSLHSDVDGQPVSLKIAVVNTLKAAHQLLANIATGQPQYQYHFVGMRNAGRDGACVPVLSASPRMERRRGKRGHNSTQKADHQLLANIAMDNRSINITLSYVCVCHFACFHFFHSSLLFDVCVCSEVMACPGYASLRCAAARTCLSPFLLGSRFFRLCTRLAGCLLPFLFVCTVDLTPLKSCYLWFLVVCFV